MGDNVIKLADRCRPHKSEIAQGFADTKQDLVDNMEGNLESLLKQRIQAFSQKMKISYEQAFLVFVLNGKISLDDLNNLPEFFENMDSLISFFRLISKHKTNFDSDDIIEKDKRKIMHVWTKTFICITEFIPRNFDMVYLMLQTYCEYEKDGLTKYTIENNDIFAETLIRTLIEISDKNNVGELRILYDILFMKLSRKKIKAFNEFVVNDLKLIKNFPEFESYLLDLISKGLDKQVDKGLKFCLNIINDPFYYPASGMSVIALKRIGTLSNI